MKERIVAAADVAVVSSKNDGNNASSRILADAVVLATGHSALDVYEQLRAAGVQLEAKGFAVGFRVEHPQKLINKIQYGAEWGPSAFTGKKLTDTANQDYFASAEAEAAEEKGSREHHDGKLPVPSYWLATDGALRWRTIARSLILLHVSRWSDCPCFHRP